MRVTKKWWFLMVAAPIVGLCVQAGFWQLDRAEEKTALVEQLQLGDGLVSEVSQLSSLDPSIAAYRVELPVMRTAEPLMFLDNKVYNRRAGYEVFGWVRPLQSDWRLLVNFGWVDGGISRASLPAVILPEVMTLRGRWLALTESYRRGAPDAEVFSEGVRMQSLASVASDVPGVFLAEGMLGQDARGPEPRLGPATHYGYAVQWFLLAMVMAGLTTWMFRRGFRA